MKEEISKPKEINIEFSAEIIDDKKRAGGDKKAGGRQLIRPSSLVLILSAAVLFVLSCVYQFTIGMGCFAFMFLCALTEASIDTSQDVRMEGKESTVTLREFGKFLYVLACFLSLAVMMVSGILYILFDRWGNLFMANKMQVTAGVSFVLLFSLLACGIVHVASKEPWRPFW